ncbi:MAG: hypothetical protein IKN42_00995, partial [Elusimicrobia bacterium]|nr:hypothetical protein [Elusimicrobiota bacterium]
VGGEIIIDGEVINSANVAQKKVIITIGNSLTSSADTVTTSEEITNSGTLIYTGGTNENVITGAGTLNVEGALINNKNISQNTININAGMFTNDDAAAIRVGTGINVASGAGLTTNANNINENAPTIINNEGTLVFTGGTNANEISGAGNLTIDGTVTNTSGKAISQSSITVNSGKSFEADVNDITTTDKIGNEGLLTFNGTGTNANKINGSGNLTINGTVINTTGKAISQSSITVNSGKSFEANVNDITTTDKIENEGTLTYTGEGTNANEISGAGNLTIDGIVTNTSGKAINQSSITVNSGKSFEADVNDITTTDKIGNEGTLTFNGTGTNANVISGAGNLTIDGTVTNTSGKAISQSSITVNNGKSFEADVNDITTTDKIGNEGTLTFNGTGTNANVISGTGETVIDGIVTNEANIEQSKVTINANKSLETNADNMKAEVANKGEYNVTGGTISYKVTGDNGIMNINTGEVTISTSVSGNNVSITKTLKLEKEEYLDSTSTLEIGSGATLDIKNGETGTVSSVKITENVNWNLKLDVNIDELSADQLNVINIVAATSQATITDIGFIGDNANVKAKNTVQITTGNSINATASPDIYSINNINYQVIARNADGVTYLDIVAYGYGGLAIAVYDGNSTYEVESDSTGKDYVTAWIDGHNYLTNDLVIKGSEGNSVLTSTKAVTGIDVNTHKLTVQDLTEYSGFNNALTVATNGELLVSTVTFTGNTGESVIKNAGTTTLSSTTFTGNGADIDVEN